MGKTITSLLVICLVVLGSSIPVYAKYPQINLIINSEAVRSDPPPVQLKNSRNVVPLRSICEAFKAEVEWVKETTTIIVHSLDKINAYSTTPLSSGRVNSAEAAKAVTVQLQGRTYFFPGRNTATKHYNFAAATSNGIVWSPAPPMEEGSGSEWIPLDPFIIYLSNPADFQLNAAKARRLGTLEIPEAADEYTRLSSLQGAGEYVVYHTSTRFRGGAQALRNQAWALKTGDPAENREILTYHAAGGYIYYWGIEEQDKLYVSVSQIPGNADGSYNYEVYVYSLEQERKTPIKHFNLGSNFIQFNYNDKSYSVTLQQG